MTVQTKSKGAVEPDLYSAEEDTSLGDQTADKEDDIEKIMNEIEGLQIDMNPPTKQNSAKKNAVGSIPEEAEPIEAGEAQEILEEFEAVGVESKGVSEENSLSMTIKGKLTLKLDYASSGQTVSVGFSEKNILIQFSDGTEFKIPVRKRPS